MIIYSFLAIQTKLINNGEWFSLSCESPDKVKITPNSYHRTVQSMNSIKRAVRVNNIKENINNPFFSFFRWFILVTNTFQVSVNEKENRIESCFHHDHSQYRNSNSSYCSFWFSMFLSISLQISCILTFIIAQITQNM